MYNLVIDVDGILTDILTPVEEYIHGYARDYLLSHKKHAELEGLSDAQIKELAEFDILSCENWDFTPLPDFIAKRIRHGFDALPQLYSDPRPMFNTQVMTRAGYANDDLTYPASSYFGKSGWAVAEATFSVWRELFAMLLHHYNITIHTHVHTEGIADLRRHWLESNFSKDKIYAKVPDSQRGAGEMTFYLDQGAHKHKEVGDVVIEDNLKNVLTADVKYRILHSAPYNSINCGENEALWHKYGSPEIQVYGTIWELWCILLNATTFLMLDDKTLTDKRKQLSKLQRFWLEGLKNMGHSLM